MLPHAGCPASGRTHGPHSGRLGWVMTAGLLLKPGSAGAVETELSADLPREHGTASWQNKVCWWQAFGRANLTAAPALQLAPDCLKIWH